MPCCAWEEFQYDTTISFYNAKISEHLIDWDAARTAWSKHHATPGEFAKSAISALKSEGDYLFALPRRKHNEKL